MSTKGGRTREMIIQESAALFNVQGIAATSIADIVERTGIQKGGLYRHFESKAQIAEAAFDYAVEGRISAVEQAITTAASAVAQLMAIARSFLALVETPILPGGCPLLNTAIEVDDSPSDLKVKTQLGMEHLRGAVREVVRQGKVQGEFPLYLNGDGVATLLIALCEGALMLTKLYDDPVHLHRALDHLQAYFETLKQP